MQENIKNILNTNLAKSIIIIIISMILYHIIKNNQTTNILKNYYKITNKLDKLNCYINDKKI